MSDYTPSTGTAWLATLQTSTTKEFHRQAIITAISSGRLVNFNLRITLWHQGEESVLCFVLVCKIYHRGSAYFNHIWGLVLLWTAQRVNAEIHGVHCGPLPGIKSLHLWSCIPSLVVLASFALLWPMIFTAHPFWGTWSVFILGHTNFTISK